MRLTASPLLSGLLLATGVLAACFQRTADDDRTAASAPAPPAAEAPAQQAGRALLETFETGSKGGYAPDEEQLASGKWLLDDALIGAAEQDHKHGQKALRLRGKGRAQMRFDLATGAGTVRVFTASYGKDGAVRWQLWYSADRGRSWQPAGTEVKVEGPGLPVAVQVNRPGPLRLEIRKTDGGDDRLNLDDFTVEPYRAGTKPPAGSTVTTTTQTVTPAPQPTTPAAAQATGAARRDDPLTFGNPSGATSNPDLSPNNYLMVKPQYTLSYSRDRGIPNWVLWHLNKAWLGAAPRQDDFRPDPALPRGWYQVTRNSYSGSGFDKGHNCPSADRSFDLDDNSSTFLMTNMIPQAPNNNQRTWNHLEDYSRDLVAAGNEVYVLMGSYGKGGTGTNGLMTTLDQGRVTVPKRIWKVLVVLPQGDNDLQRVAAGQARLIAVDTPNDNTIDPDWARYRVSVDAIENATGYDLLSKLPVEVQAQLEAKVDSGPTR
ncbi:DNA/RNA non-specific endonuclease [Hymenobacter busanensis]|uniref:DNA/RNA non-specific endonuclease n=1 Tax=Hymenobacter busanensis TaxID=2607656 RepID=A0A7L4ZTF7_9BACT|nr:DNA/RNA non-specific endonuclease [Hymenobacter busanensis]KAA9339585.1 DNA/RNA non-specific endonuclease [Hymenobacter busanensis]QHJ06659.1 DNA/RNA non-specific endonuclease [Hymenobacter busanensis]